MHISRLPAALGSIQETGRSIQEIIATLEVRNVAIFQKSLFERNAEPIPPLGTPYNFLAAIGKELPEDARSSAPRAFEVAYLQHGQLRKPTLRSALLLMECMTRERLYADIFVMSNPISDTQVGPLFITLGYEDEEGVPWIATVAADYVFKFDNEVILFLGPNS